MKDNRLIIIKDELIDMYDSFNKFRIIE